MAESAGACHRSGEQMGRMVLTMLGMVAEMEVGFICDRQRAAKAKGFTKGVLLLSTALVS
jgi:DNA invertase Pin-like site-specific DNA recombinase